MEILCVNGKFPADFAAFYKEHGVKTPEQDKIYNIRAVIRHASKVGDEGAIGLWLEELPNPKVPVQHPVLGEQMVEPSWHQDRFRTLKGEHIDIAALREMVKAPETRVPMVTIN